MRTHKTYEIVSPLATHFRRATCAEIECAGYVNGWKTTLLPGTREHTLLLSLRGTYRFDAGVRNDDGTETFTFPAGQPCFRASQHRVPLERDPLFVVRDGVTRQHRAQDWVDDFATHQDKLSEAIKRG